ncbi:hypothetical protein [Aquimarina muelleri]|uniref:Lipoprotein n=1 Tax=Aquimarina muelleri TaxID=279356 RepID=A0A918JTK4_9FLAO|nr:hypothetical protein [Aquimarina muelleri]MCX2764032.1 hypothetical protein [Aquimarina muelleri]GGX12043.1 hypothetical protein GCM10007384_12220 [Aquimarina muelleri]
MKKILILLVLILASCSTDNESIVENSKIKDLPKDIKIINKQSDNEYDTEGKLTIKYREGITEEQKQNIRNAEHNFLLLGVEITNCKEVEIWYITYCSGCRPGPKIKSLPKDALDKTALDWYGDCKDF